MKTKIIFILSLVISLFFLFYTFFYLENIIYQEINLEWPGDCGHFVVWMSSSWYEKNLSLQEITYQINPLVIFTGPITLKKNLKKVGIKSTFYNNFSIKEIKEKIDEKMPVIVMINTNSTFLGLNHYLFVFDYDEEGFYFYDSYYWIDMPYEENETNYWKPYFMNFSEFESKRQNVMQPSQFIGIIENAVEMEKFVIVINESKQENINNKIMNMFYYQYIAEKAIEILGRIVVFISPRI